MEEPYENLSAQQKQAFLQQTMAAFAVKQEDLDEKTWLSLGEACGVDYFQYSKRKLAYQPNLLPLIVPEQRKLVQKIAIPLIKAF